MPNQRPPLVLPSGPHIELVIRKKNKSRWKFWPNFSYFIFVVKTKWNWNTLQTKKNFSLANAISSFALTSARRQYWRNDGNFTSCMIYNWRAKFSYHGINLNKRIISSVLPVVMLQVSLAFSISQILYFLPRPLNQPIFVLLMITIYSILWNFLVQTSLHLWNVNQRIVCNTAICNSNSIAFYKMRTYCIF